MTFADNPAQRFALFAASFGVPAALFAYLGQPIFQAADPTALFIMAFCLGVGTFYYVGEVGRLAKAGGFFLVGVGLWVAIQVCTDGVKQRYWLEQRCRVLQTSMLSRQGEAAELAAVRFQALQCRAKFNGPLVRR